MAQVRILRRPDVVRALDMSACIDAVERAFVAYSAGGAELPGVIHLDVPEAGGEIHVKAGHLHGGPHYAIKMASGFAGVEPPAIDGMVALFDARDGSPAALLLDGGYLTDVRTGAAGGVAARWLAPDVVERVAVLGTGGQARQQLDALAVVRPGPWDVRVWGRDQGHAAACVEDLAARGRLPEGAAARVVADVADALEAADVVLTCTASRAVLVDAAMLPPGAHVTALGSDGVGKQELAPDVLETADVLVVDSLDQCGRLGELQHAGGQAGRAVELGTIVAGAAPGRTTRDQVTVCDLTGVGVQDVAAAEVVVARAIVEDLGETILL
jgi:ornithine cyclodeaminase